MFRDTLIELASSSSTSAVGDAMSVGYEDDTAILGNGGRKHRARRYRKHVKDEKTASNFCHPWA